MGKYFLNEDSNILIKEFKPRKRINNFHYNIEILNNSKKKSNFAKIIELSNDEEEEEEEKEELNHNHNLTNEKDLTYDNITSYSNEEFLNVILNKVPMLNIYKVKNTYTIRMLVNNMLIKRKYKNLKNCVKERDNILKQLIKYEPNFREKLFRKYLVSIKNKKK